MRSTFEYQVLFSDYVAASRQAGRRLVRTTGAPWLQHALSLGAAIASGCATAAVILLARKQPAPAPQLALLALVAMFALCVLLGAWPSMKARLHLRRALSDAGPVLGPQRLDVESGGLRLIQGPLESHLGWDAIRAVEDSAEAVLLFVDHAAFVAIPASAFASKAERDEFVSLVRARMDPAGIATQLELELEPTAASYSARLGEAAGTAAPRFAALARFLGALACNLRAGAKLVRFRAVEPEAFSVSVEQLVALIGIDLLLTFLGDFIAVGRHGSINLLDFDTRNTKLHGLFALVMQSPAYQLH